MDLSLSDLRKAEIIDGYFTRKNYFPWVVYRPIGNLLVSECRKMGEGGLWVSTAAALVEQESGGKNIFGCDTGGLFCQHDVTPIRVARLIHHIQNGGASNGVGLTQLTYPPFIYEAEKLGGADLPKYQMRVGFKILNDLLAAYPYYNALEAYNTGNGRWNDPNNPYDQQFAEKHVRWKERLN